MNDDTTNDWRLLAPFGAGLSRKRRITFIPAGTESLPSYGATTKPRSSGTEISSYYLSLVGLSPSPSSSSPSSSSSSSSSSSPAATAEITKTLTEEEREGEEEGATAAYPLCEICSLPITSTAHPHSTAHQSQIPHSDPPHHYPRTSIGLKVLETHGWDPDEKQGLGPEGRGIRWPVKAVKKNNTLGIGVDMKVPKTQKTGDWSNKNKSGRKVKVVGAKGVRKIERERAEQRKKLLNDLGRGDDFESLLRGETV